MKASPRNTSFFLSLFFIFAFTIRSQLAFSQKDTITITPFKVEAEAIPKAYKTTEFDSSTIENTKSLAQLLSQNSTVFIKTYGSGSLATVSFRGTGASHTKVQWNGINLNSPMNGQIDFSLYPTFFFDEAQIHYGASGLIDGNGALGGSVLMHNTEFYNKGFSAVLNQTIGSFGNYTTAAKGSFSNKKWSSTTKIYYNIAKNDFEYENSSKLEKPTETQVNANLIQYGFQQSIFRKFKNSSLGMHLWYFYSDRNLPHTMQVALNDENQIDESLRAIAIWKGLSNNFQYKISSGFVKNKLAYANILANITSNNNSYLIDNNINTKLYLNKNFTLINNVNVKYENAKADSYSKTHTRFNSSWLVGINKDYKKLTLNLFNRSILIGNELKPIAPTLGLNYQLIKGNKLSIKANTGLNYNYPTFNDLFWKPGGNLKLKPEKAEMSEVGLKYSLRKKSTFFNTELTVFYSEIDDWIIWQPTEFGYWSPSNLKRVENKGFETVIKVSNTFKKVTVKQKISYAYTQSTNKKAKNEIDNSVNKQLIYVPFHKLNYSLILNYKSLIIMYNYNFTSKRFTTSDNNWYLPENFISNIAVSKKIKITTKTTLNATFKINNLLNQSYQSIAWRAVPGRNYLLSLNLKFK